MLKKVAVESAAEAYLELLASRGVEYFFANAGTDFAPIIEAYAKRGAQGQALPRPITVPHEVPAVAMAHGYAMVTRRAQAVMVHVIVGAANALGGVINAARAQVPILFSAGRTPLSEGASRQPRPPDPLGQESFDQGLMMREWVKWDYELRNFVQLETVVDRALALAQAEPPGPVYLTLPREVLAERHETFEYAEPSRLQKPGLLRPAPADIDDAAQLLAGARNPIIITKAAGRDPLAVAALVTLAETLGAPVFQDHGHNYMNFPGDHPLHAGYDAAAHLDEADVILVVEADAPWYPHIKSPRPDTRVIQVASDPLFSGYPIRGFPSDLTLGGAPRLTLEALAEPRLDSSMRAQSRAAPPLGDRAHAPAAGVGRARNGGLEGYADRHGVGLAVHRRSHRRADARGERVRPRHDPDELSEPRDLLRGLAVERSRLGARRRARGQARRARQDADLLRGRRRLYLRLTHRRALGLPRP
jgi:acetolactate synthase-1/2/3 large subunit